MNVSSILQLEVLKCVTSAVRTSTRAGGHVSTLIYRVKISGLLSVYVFVNLFKSKLVISSGVLSTVCRNCRNFDLHAGVASSRHTIGI